MESWHRIGSQILLIADASAWWLGDWLVYGEDKYPSRYREALERTELKYKTLKNYAWVARKIPRSRRRDHLSFHHHAEVASRPPLEQDQWLARAERLGWSIHELRRALRSSHGTKPTPALARTYVQLDPGPERADRWHEAAGIQGRGLIEWIVAVVDEAAREIVEATSR